MRARRAPRALGSPRAARRAASCGYAETSSDQNPSGRAGNAGSTPPASGSDPNKPRTTTAPMTIADERPDDRPDGYRRATRCGRGAGGTCSRPRRAHRSPVAPRGCVPRSGTTSAVAALADLHEPAELPVLDPPLALDAAAASRRASEVGDVPAPGRQEVVRLLEPSGEGQEQQADDPEQERQRQRPRASSEHAVVLRASWRSRPGPLRTADRASAAGPRTPPRRTSAGWRTRASGIIRTRNPASRTRQHRSSPWWAASSRSSSSPARFHASREISIAAVETAQHLEHPIELPLVDLIGLQG